MEPMYDEVVQSVEQAEVAPGGVDLNQLDDEIVRLELAVGRAVVRAAVEGDIEGLQGFVDEIARAHRRYMNLERLLSLDQEALEKLLSNLQAEPAREAQEPPAEQPAPPPTEAEPPAPVNEREAIMQAVMESRRGANARTGAKRSSLRDYFPGG